MKRFTAAILAMFVLASCSSQGNQPTVDQNTHDAAIISAENIKSEDVEAEPSANSEPDGELLAEFNDVPESVQSHDDQPNFETSVKTASEPSNTIIGKVEGLSAYIDFGMLTYNGAMLQYSYEGDESVSFGSEFKLQKEVDGVWYDLINTGEEDFVPYEESHTVLEHYYTHAEKLDWSAIYGELTDGKYRAIKEIITHSGSENIAVEFWYPNGVTEAEPGEISEIDYLVPAESEYEELDIFRMTQAFRLKNTSDKRIAISTVLWLQKLNDDEWKTIQKTGKSNSVNLIHAAGEYADSRYFSDYTSSEPLEDGEYRYVIAVYDDIDQELWSNARVSEVSNPKYYAYEFEITPDTPLCSNPDFEPGKTESASWSMIDEDNGGVYITLDMATLTSSGVEYIIHNEHGDDIAYGAGESLQREVDGVWYTLVPTSYNFGVPAIQLWLEKDGTERVKMNWSAEYGSLPDGHYRIVKSFDDGASIDKLEFKVVVSCEFDLPAPQVEPEPKPEVGIADDE